MSALVNIGEDHNTPPAGAARLAAASTLCLPDSVNGRYSARRPRPVANRGGRGRRPPGNVPGARSATAARYLLAGIRIGFGSIFLGTFLRRAFSLGHDGTVAAATPNGDPSPGFLSSATVRPFVDFDHTVAASVLFTIALLGIGAALVLGVGIRLAAAGGTLLTLVTSGAPSLGINPGHLIYAAVLIVLALLSAGNTIGFGRVWVATPLVQRASWLT